MTERGEYTIRKTTKLELGLVGALILNGIGIGIFVGQVRSLTAKVDDMTLEMRANRAQAPEVAVLKYRVEQLEKARR